MSYFEDNDSINGDSDADSGSDTDSGSDAGSYNHVIKQKPKSVISLEEEDDEENGSEIADSEIDDEDDEDDDLAEGREDEEDDDNEDGEKGIKEGIVEDGEEEIVVTKKAKKVKIAATNEIKKPSYQLEEDEDEEDDDETGELYLKKFDKEVNDNYVLNFHPECALHNYDEVLSMTKVVRDKHGIIVDDLHKTVPFLTKYEKARILGQRAKQINSGGSIFVKVPENVLDGYLIAELELLEKRIPFIIRRPLPNGGSEYWSIKDLENISF
jgi:DNA-directed RNA polymerase I, II, and III subunit RPABC2